MSVGRGEGEEGPQRVGMQQCVGAVARGSAFGDRKDPGRLVIPDRLRRQAVPTRQVNRPEVTVGLKVSRRQPADFVEKFQSLIQRYRLGT